MLLEELFISPCRVWDVLRRNPVFCHEFYHMKTGWQASITTVLLATAFVMAWHVLADSIPTWSDEISHLALARQLLTTCDPSQPDFARCASSTPSLVYSLRAIEFTQLVALSFQYLGASLWAGRLVSLFFTLAAWFFFMVYLRLWQRASFSILVVTTVLFFGQSMVLEQSLNARFYAPLLFYLLVALVAVWEVRVCWRDRRWVPATAWLVVGAGAVGLSMLWSLLQYVVLAVAVFLLVLSWRKWNPPVSISNVWVRFQTWPRLGRYALWSGVLIAAIAFEFTVPLVVDRLGALMLGVQPVHSTGLDNIFGLLRFAVALNVILWLWVVSGKTISGLGEDFYQWLLATGVVSGIMIGALMNHNFIYYGRYFYLSVTVAVLAAAPLFLHLPTRKHLTSALVAWLTVNGLLSAFVFGLERSNIHRAFDWVRMNTTARDVVFLGDIDLYFDGGEDLRNRVIPVRTPTDDPVADRGQGFGYLRRSNINPFLTDKAVMVILDKQPVSRIYYLTALSHDTRDRLTRWITGHERNEIATPYLIKKMLGFPQNDQPSIYWFLTSPEVGDSVVSNLVNVRVFELDRRKLYETLARRIS
mgnify:CR=1 FL=1